MTIKKAISEDIDYYIKVPENVNIKILERGWEGDRIEIARVKSEIEIQGVGSDIVMQEIQGPVVASSSGGDIFASFTKVNTAKPMSISATSGFIDVALPTTTKATIKLDAQSGEVYTDLDIQMDKDKKFIDNCHCGMKGTGKLNGGGVEISLKAISDDIYLRKKA